MIKVLFVCMGNICRSPMAEAVFKDLVARAGLKDKFEIDSVGTDSYHVGEPAHPGTRRILAAHHIACDSVSRQVTRADLETADYIVALDRYNLSDLRHMAPQAHRAGRLRLLLSFIGAESGHPTGASDGDVPDPYYTGNFEEVYQLVQAGCRGLLAHIRRQEKI